MLGLVAYFKIHFDRIEKHFDSMGLRSVASDGEVVRGDEKYCEKTAQLTRTGDDDDNARDGEAVPL